MSDKPRFVQSGPFLAPSEIQELTPVYRDCLTALLAVDDMVKGVVDQLSRFGVLNNTMLICTLNDGYF